MACTARLIVHCLNIWILLFYISNFGRDYSVVRNKNEGKMEAKLENYEKL